MAETEQPSSSGAPMDPRLWALARRLWPGLDAVRGPDQPSVAGDLLTALYVAPFVAVGLLWLAAATDGALLRTAWPTLLLFLVLMRLLHRLIFSFYLEVDRGQLADFSGSFGSIVFWSAALLFGPTALWLDVLPTTVVLARRWRSAPATQRFNLLRNAALGLAESTLAALLALTAYRWLGGSFPLAGLEPRVLLPALGATLLWLLLSRLLWLPLVFHWATTETVQGGARGKRAFLRFVMIFLFWSLLVDPFAVLAAGLYAEHGVVVYLFFVMGLLLASALVRQMGDATERSQQRSRELERLEQLGRALLSAPPDASTLPLVLAEHVPAMFPHAEVEIRLLAQGLLLRVPDEWEGNEPEETFWAWARQAPADHVVLPGEAPPWPGAPAPRTRVVVPITDQDRPEPLGAIFLVLPERGIGPVESTLPAARALAAQIGSALSRAASYRRTLAHQRVEQELAVAGAIQASFLPTDLPSLDGWQFALTLAPARQTSGDFCDWVALPDGRWGIIIADVVDKGLGAALFMALSRTLIRTYAVEHPQRPDLALAAANCRILSDTHSSLFVTVFYAILDPQTGQLDYCNAGHNPPFLLRAASGAIESLPATGLPLGIVEHVPWGRGCVQVEPGDLLLLYTDGITDVQDAQQRFFGKERLLALVESCAGRPAPDLQQAVVGAVYRWMGDAAQFDDLTLLVLGRDGG